jgi:hypothetical protein
MLTIIATAVASALWVAFLGWRAGRVERRREECLRRHGLIR